MVLLDTHAWVWWLTKPDMLPKKATQVIRAAMKDYDVHISTMSTWEIAMLVARGRLEFATDYREFIRQTQRLAFVKFVAAGNENISIKSGTPFSLGVLTRYVMPVGQDKLIAAVNVDTFKVPYEIRGATTTNVLRSRDGSTKVFNLNVDLAYHQNFQEGKLKIIYSAGVGSTSMTLAMADNIAPATYNNELSITQFFIPLGVAAEHKTFETLKTRIGVRKNVISNKKTVDKTATTSNTTETSFYADDELLVAMGLGWTPAEKVQVDLAMNANAFKPDTFFSAISARYHY
ncbi:MAG: type II toxin-antitoxin system VapC family toxin [Turneriella sp.]|nr:type II toxin-antitoxin system VapC family toxin [Turneriella sp.]